MKKDLEIILSEKFFGNVVSKIKKSRAKTTLKNLLKLRSKQKTKQYINLHGKRVEVYDSETPENLRMIQSIANRNYKAALSKLLKDFYETYKKTWVEPNQTALTPQQFLRNLTPESISVYKSANGKITDIEISFDAKDMFLGHWLTVQLLIPSGKPSYTNMYG